VAEIYIHAGAHRTGTSSFQLMLAQNRPVLRAAGILPLYPKRDGAKGGRLRLRLPGPSVGSAGLRARQTGVKEELARHMADVPESAKILLSEENIPGRMFHFFSGRFYPAAPRRMEMLAEALKSLGHAPPVSLVFVIRPYADLFVSAYRKRAEDNAVAPFSEIAPAMVHIDAGWPQLLAQFQTYLAPKHLIVRSYAHRGRSVDLLEDLLGARLADLKEPARRLNLSATDAALQALQERYRAGETLDRAHWKDVIAHYADQTEQRSFACFTQAQRTRLDDLYEADCAAIAKMAGVTFLA